MIVWDKMLCTQQQAPERGDNCNCLRTQQQAGVVHVSRAAVGPQGGHVVDIAQDALPVGVVRADAGAVAQRGTNVGVPRLPAAHTTDRKDGKAMVGSQRKKI